MAPHMVLFAIVMAMAFGEENSVELLQSSSMLQATTAREHVKVKFSSDDIDEGLWSSPDDVNGDQCKKWCYSKKHGPKPWKELPSPNPDGWKSSNLKCNWDGCACCEECAPTGPQCESSHMEAPTDAPTNMPKTYTRHTTCHGRNCGACPEDVNSEEECRIAAETMGWPQNSPLNSGSGQVCIWRYHGMVVEWRHTADSYKKICAIPRVKPQTYTRNTACSYSFQKREWTCGVCAIPVETEDECKIAAQTMGWPTNNPLNSGSGNVCIWRADGMVVEWRYTPDGYKKICGA